MTGIARPTRSCGGLRGLSCASGSTRSLKAPSDGSKRCWSADRHQACDGPAARPASRQEATAASSLRTVLQGAVDHVEGSISGPAKACRHLDDTPYLACRPFGRARRRSFQSRSRVDTTHLALSENASGPPPVITFRGPALSHQEVGGRLRPSTPTRLCGPTRQRGAEGLCCES